MGRTFDEVIDPQWQQMVSIWNATQWQVFGGATCKILGLLVANTMANFVFWMSRGVAALNQNQHSWRLHKDSIKTPVLLRTHNTPGHRLSKCHTKQQQERWQWRECNKAAPVATLRGSSDTPRNKMQSSGGHIAPLRTNKELRGPSITPCTYVAQGKHLGTPTTGSANHCS